MYVKYMEQKSFHKIYLNFLKILLKIQFTFTFF